MELAGIRGLVALADTGSIKAAATKLGVSRATLRRRIQGLERNLGVALVSVGESRVALTEAGQLCVAEGRQLVRQSEDLAALIRVEGTQVSGLLRVAAPIGAAGPEIGLDLRYFALHFPQLRLQLWFTADPAAALAEGADIAVLFGGYPLGDWQVSSLGSLGIGAYAHANYLTHAEPLTDAQDLARHRLLHGTAGRIPTAAWPLTDGSEVPIEPWLSTTDLDVVRQAVHEGLGIGLVLEDLAGDLVRVLDGVVGTELAVWALTTPLGAKTPRVRAFVEAARSYMTESNRPDGHTAHPAPSRA